LAHAQFETIHPFLDGNGRVGRLLITFLLCQRNVLHRPLLYLSHYLKVRRTEYYDRLMAIRDDGNWEGWMKFFLRGVEEVSEEAINSSRQIFAMREQHRELLSNSLGNGAASGLRLLDYLYEQPIVNIRLVEKHLRSSFVTANRLIEQFVKLNIIKETTGGQRNRRYSYFPYLALFESSATAHQDKSPSV
jgi:Fic family protein